MCHVLGERMERRGEARVERSYDRDDAFVTKGSLSPTYRGMMKSLGERWNFPQGKQFHGKSRRGRPFSVRWRHFRGHVLKPAVPIIGVLLMMSFMTLVVITNKVRQREIGPTLTMFTEESPVSFNEPSQQVNHGSTDPSHVSDSPFTSLDSAKVLGRSSRKASPIDSSRDHSHQVADESRSPPSNHIVASQSAGDSSVGQEDPLRDTTHKPLKEPQRSSNSNMVTAPPRHNSDIHDLVEKESSTGRPATKGTDASDLSTLNPADLELRKNEQVELQKANNEVATHGPLTNSDHHSVLTMNGHIIQNVHKIDHEMTFESPEFDDRSARAEEACGSFTRASLWRGKGKGASQQLPAYGNDCIVDVVRKLWESVQMRTNESTVSDRVVISYWDHIGLGNALRNKGTELLFTLSEGIPMIDSHRIPHTYYYRDVAVGDECAYSPWSCFFGNISTLSYRNSTFSDVRSIDAHNYCTYRSLDKKPVRVGLKGEIVKPYDSNCTLLHMDRLSTIEEGVGLIREKALEMGCDYDGKLTLSDGSFPPLDGVSSSLWYHVFQRPISAVEKTIRLYKELVQFKTDGKKILGVHIRRGDVCLTQPRRCRKSSCYEHAILSLLQSRFPSDTPSEWKILVISDDDNAVEDMFKAFPDMEVITTPVSRTKYAMNETIEPGKRTKKDRFENRVLGKNKSHDRKREATLEILLDMILLSQADAFVLESSTVDYIALSIRLATANEPPEAMTF